MSNISKRFIADPYSFIFRSCLLRRYFLFSFSPPSLFYLHFRPFTFLFIYIFRLFIYIFPASCSNYVAAIFTPGLRDEKSGAEIDRWKSTASATNSFRANYSFGPLIQNDRMCIYIYIQSEIIPVDLNHRGKSMHAGEDEKLAMEPNLFTSGT